jgi:hypothetical protein
MADNSELTVDVLLRAKNGTQIANEVGKSLSKVAKEWGTEVKELTGAAVQDATRFAFASGQAGAAMKKFVKDNLAGPYMEFRKAINAEDAAAAQKHHKVLQERARRFKRELDSMASAHERVQKRRERTGEQKVDAFAGAAQQLRGGPQGIMSLLRGGGKGLGDLGKAKQQDAADLAEKAAKMKGPGAAKGAAKAAGMANMGKTMAAMGTAVATFAAIAGAILMLIKLFADLESKMKGMNKTLLASAGAADFGLGHGDIVGGKLSDTLEELRNQTTALNSNFMKFRAGAEEQQKILSTLNQAGLSYARMNEEIKEGTKFMKSYSDVTAIALTYSRNIGVESGEIAQRMGAFTLETGDSLNEIAQGFSVIQREAMAAGFVTKRFYSTVIEATSGMAFYGVRIQETAQVLSSLDQLMGEAMGPEMLKQLTGKGKGMGADERLREIILKDPEFMADQYSKAFARKNASIANDFAKDLGKFLQKGETLDDFLSLTETEISDRLAGKLSAPQIERFTQASVLKQAGEGDTRAMQRARGFGGVGLELGLASSATQVFGGKTINEVFAGEGEVDFIALAKVTGKSIDELEKLNTIFRNAASDLKAMEKLAAKDPAERSDEDRKFLKQMNAAFGATINESTREIMRGNIAIEDAVEFAAGSTVDTSKELEQQMTKDQEIASEISRNITGLNEIMEQTIATTLNEIYNVLAAIGKVITSDTEQAARVAATESARDARLEALQKNEEARDQEVKAQKALEKAKAEGDTAQIALAKEALKQAKEETDATAAMAVASEVVEETAKNLSNDQINAQGAGVLALIDAIEESTGEKAFGGAGKKQFASELERTLPRMAAGIEDAPWWDIHADLQEWQKNDPWIGTDIDALGENWVEDVLKNKALTSELGGEENVRKMAVEAQRKTSEMQEGFTLGDMTRENMAELQSAFSAAIAAQSAIGAFDRESQDPGFDVPEAPMKMPGGIAGGIVGGLTGGVVPVGDLILPAGGGAAYMTSASDSIFAAKPGGPIAQAMGGGSTTVINNIHGGDTLKIYNTIMQVLKATGKG